MEIDKEIETDTNEERYGETNANDTEDPEDPIIERLYDDTSGHFYTRRKSGAVEWEEPQDNTNISHEDDDVIVVDDDDQESNTMEGKLNESNEDPVEERLFDHSSGQFATKLIAFVIFVSSRTSLFLKLFFSPSSQFQCFLWITKSSTYYFVFSNSPLARLLMILCGFGGC